MTHQHSSVASPSLYRRLPRPVRRRLNAAGNGLRAAFRLVSVGPRQWGELVEAQFFVCWAHFLVRTRPEGQLVDRAGLAPGAGEAASVERLAEARRLALQVKRVAAFGLSRPLCLVRAVAINRLLEAHGIRGSVVRIGVQLSDGAFAAHAWVEYGGEVLGDFEEHVSRFNHLRDIQVLR